MTGEGIQNIKTDMAMEPDKSQDYVTLLVLHGLSDNDIRFAIPGMVRPRMEFAQFLEKSGNREMAVDEYKEVLMIDPGNEKALKGLKRLK